jgi:hypothetical protein
MTVRDIASNSRIRVGSVETIIHEHLLFKVSVCLVGPKDVNVQPEGTACCCVCRTSATLGIRGKHIPRANSDP